MLSLSFTIETLLHFPSACSRSILRQPLKVILHCLLLSDFNFVCIIYKEKGRRGCRSIKILLAPGNYLEVLVQPRWWNVLMFMHKKGITHSNSWTTISLPHCVIINGLDCIQNASAPLIFKSYPVPNNIVRMNACPCLIAVLFDRKNNKTKAQSLTLERKTMIFFLFQIHGTSRC